MRHSLLLLSLFGMALTGCSSGSKQPVILAVSALSPASVVAGDGGTITVTGTAFTSRTSIRVGGTTLPTTLTSSTQMSAILPAMIANTVGSYPLAIVDAEPASQGGTATLTTPFTLVVGAPVISVSSTAPALLLAGQASANVTVTGSGFLPSVTATLGGASHAITYVDKQHLTLPLSSSDLLYARTLPLVLSNGTAASSVTTSVQVTNYTKAAQQYSAYGDSITAGYKLADATTAYPTLLSKANSLTLANLARVGDQACDTFTPLSMQHDGYAPQANTVFSYMIGTNDTYVKGAGAYEAIFNRCDQAVVSWLGLPASAKVQPGSAALAVSGGCSNTADTTRYGVAYCSAAGSFNDQAFATYGAPIYVWMLMDDKAPAATTITLTVDGTASGSFAVAPSPAIATLNNATSSIALLRVPVPAGTHAVTVTANGKGAGLLALGTVPASRAGLPPVIVGDVPWQRNYSPVATVDVQQAYSADIRANVLLLSQDGLDLRFAPDRLFMQGTNDEMADALHPNDLGHQHLQTAFQTGFVGINASSGLTAQATRVR